MNTTWGADPDALDRLAAQMDACATLLARHRVTLNAHIHSAPWRGQEADRFRQTWNSRWSPSLATTVSALQAAHVVLRRNAEEQRGASAASSAPGSGSFPFGGRSDQSRWDDLGNALALAGGVELVIQGFVRAGAARGAIKNAYTLGRQFGRFERDLPEPLGRFARVLQVAGVWTDTAKTVVDLEHGDASASDVFHLAWDAAGFVPVVGEAEAAWGVGSTIGTLLAQHFHTADHMWNLMSGGQGDVQNDPQAAHDLVQRYSGPMSYVHITEDIAGGAVSHVSRWVSSL